MTREMKLREVLEADWTVDRLYITVRTSEGRFVTKYCIGPNLKPSKGHRWLYETKAGDVYEQFSARVIYINKIIQFKQSSKPYKGSNRPVGVVLKEIPKELLELEITFMAPTDCGRDVYGWHGYRMDCTSDLWMGISGEDKIVKGGSEE